MFSAQCVQERACQERTGAFDAADISAWGLPFVQARHTE